ncbi:HDOD domain-containing protein [Psychromonas sp. KJ10-10]|uniref:HDOD domain-containing protein n=1 Tax=Psychromonas sp. KJ10-10 TaxID=3391823 RepID=UPI0039B3A321
MVNIINLLGKIDARKKKKSLKQWIEILSQQELPAITSVACTLDKFSNDDISSIPSLSKAILHDQALSASILKVVNNMPRSAGSRVNTISRARYYFRYSNSKKCLHDG